jgi:hypothetical protein
MPKECQCDDPFEEHSLLCKSCEARWIDGLLKMDADRIPPDDADGDPMRWSGD